MNYQQIRLRQKVTLVGVGSLVGCVFSAGLVQAQVTVFEGLPPLPPNIPSLGDTAVDAPLGVPSAPKPAIQEFNFEAPRSPVTPSFSSPQNQYRVEVASTDPLMLATVKRIEPGAFMRGDRIQAGVFSKQQNAQSLQDNLQQQGIEARIVAIAGNSSSPLAVGSGAEEGKGYFVAIPVRRDAVTSVQNQLIRAGINASLIQERTAPRGRHIAVGPFASRQEADMMNMKVRGADLDGRLYFQD